MSSLRLAIPLAAAAALALTGCKGKSKKATNYLQLVLSNMEGVLPEVSIEEPQSVEFKGREAMTAEIEAVSSGLKFHYKILAFVHQGFGYQLLSWHNVDPAQPPPDRRVLRCRRHRRGGRHLPARPGSGRLRRHSRTHRPVHTSALPRQLRARHRGLARNDRHPLAARSRKLPGRGQGPRQRSGRLQVAAIAKR